jgi:hypothetical protein
MGCPDTLNLFSDANIQKLLESFDAARVPKPTARKVEEQGR